MQKGFIFLIISILSACSRQSGFKNTGSGFGYRLEAFGNNSTPIGNLYAKLSLSYAAGDSVFFSSSEFENGCWFIRADSLSPNFLNAFLARCSVGDSVTLELGRNEFLKQMCYMPDEMAGVQSVHLRFRVLAAMSRADCEASCQQFRRQESYDLQRFGRAEGYINDSLSGIWIKNGYIVRPCSSADPLFITYKGYFLDGRVCDNGASHFEFIPGTPDQFISGLNFVIPCLKPGQNVKLVLPSALAFKESGSEDGVVPPCTPVFYELAIEKASTE